MSKPPSHTPHKKSVSKPKIIVPPKEEIKPQKQHDDNFPSTQRDSKPSKMLEEDDETKALHDKIQSLLQNSIE